MVSPLSGKTIGKVVEAQVHGKKVILISTSLFAIVFDGHNIWVETSQLYKGKKILFYTEILTEKLNYGVFFTHEKKPFVSKFLCRE